MDPKVATFVAQVAVAETCSDREQQKRRVTWYTVAVVSIETFICFVLSWQIILHSLQLFAETNLFKSISCFSAYCRPIINIYPRLTAPSAWTNTILSRWKRHTIIFFIEVLPSEIQICVILVCALCARSLQSNIKPLASPSVCELESAPKSLNRFRQNFFVEYIY